LLKSTVAETRAAITDLEKQLQAAGVPIPPPENTLPDLMPTTPEDFWSPTLEVRSFSHNPATITWGLEVGRVGCLAPQRRRCLRDIAVRLAPPGRQVPFDYAHKERYGRISTVPSHDGTECFSWDSALWGFADHFKVCARRTIQSRKRSRSRKLLRAGGLHVVLWRCGTAAGLRHPGAVTASPGHTSAAAAQLHVAVRLAGISPLGPELRTRPCTLGKPSVRGSTSLAMAKCGLMF
jgi:hypothetical protein